MARTATDYSQMIQKKEEDIVRMTTHLDSAKEECGQLSKQIAELHGRNTTLASELKAQQDDRLRSSSAQVKLQAELDELRAVLEAKTTEDTRRSEADKSREEELADLRSRVANLSQELATTRSDALENRSKLQVQLYPQVHSPVHPPNC